MATPTPAALDQQAAKLRDQAAALNRGQANRQERSDADFGIQVDDAQRTAASARGAAASATTRSTELHDRAKEATRMAKDFEDEATRHEATGDPIDARLADDLREQAQLLRAGAASDTSRAERSEQAARAELDRAEGYDREAARNEQVSRDRSSELDHMRHAANKLEGKAEAIEDAARNLRAADAAFDPADRQQLLTKAEASLKSAESITPDLSRIEVDALVEAGIPVSQVPGNELMDPNTVTSTVTAPGSDDITGAQPYTDDTDLLAPDVDPAAQVPDASADGEAVAARDPYASDAYATDGSGSDMPAGDPYATDSIAMDSSAADSYSADAYDTEEPAEYDASVAYDGA